ncbi:MAG: UdgX family uracil-DNA binding protein [Alphaproteobacteria bacterium]|nr:UdgX family uracil-DNA binding protein [Alphaproteobacteria bacterium]
MYAVEVPADAGSDEFRRVARRALSHEIAPQTVNFVPSGSSGLFPILPEERPGFHLTVSRSYAALLDDAICHRAEDRFALLYAVLWRLKHSEPDLVSRTSDAAVAQLSLYGKAVRRDVHKMHAFVRFHETSAENGPVFLAWFEPEHFILRRAAPFFANRFANMRWIIATSIGTAAWDTKELTFGPALERPRNLHDCVLNEVWQTYYRTTFNPARLNTKLMTREMPRKYWGSMPETGLIPDMVSGARERLADMDRQPDVSPRFAAKIGRSRKPESAPANDWAALKQEALGCTACPLHLAATQTVFGEGPLDSRIVFVGEQPGDFEDIAGRPFVGPAGRMFHRALKEAGIDRAQVYVTNAVKHFKLEPRGKRRIHSRPSTAEVQVCRHWLFRELDLIDPELVVALGATAAQALSGKPVAVTKMRGIELSWPDDRRGIITVHPSFLLRLANDAARAAEYEKFVADLRLVALLVGGTELDIRDGKRNAA